MTIPNKIPLDRLYIEVIHRRIERLFPVKYTPYSDEQIKQYGNTYHILHSDSYDKMGFDKAKEEIEHYQNEHIKFLKEKENVN